MIQHIPHICHNSNEADTPSKPLIRNPTHHNPMTRWAGCVPATILATVPVNMAEYPARKILGKYGTGLSLLYAIRIQYWNMLFARDKAAYTQYKTCTASTSQG
jgi:hypothetical protein